MDLDSLYGASFVNWQVVSGSWSKRTISSRLLLFAARHYLEQAEESWFDDERHEAISDSPLPEEVKRAFSSPPGTPDTDGSANGWGKFVDAALVAELEMVSYGERPPLLYELRTGLEQASREAGPETPLGRWFIARSESLPGDDLPDEPGYIPV